MEKDELMEALAADYRRAAHAMQSGVAAELDFDPSGQLAAATPKHLRVGVNSALSDSGALAKLLIEKGIITDVEYVTAIKEGMESEASRYEGELSARVGRKVTLG